MKTAAMAPGVRTNAAFLLAFAFLVAPVAARAHAYLRHADPKVGSRVARSPEQIRIWFDCDLEPALSSMAVHGPDGGTVDDGHARVDPSDPKLLEVSVPRLVPGTYRVTWSVMARDDRHRTSGNYVFTVR